MSELLGEYGLFLAKTLTVVAAVGALIVAVASQSRRGRWTERLEVRNLNRKYDAMSHALRKEMLSKKEYLKSVKEERAREKAERKRRAAAGERRKRVYVLDFRGDIRAKAVAALREEVSAILIQAATEDEVLVRLENAGGLVHDHGLAASQLARLRERGIPLVVAVDKVAASGGYLMACVADRILAAPFAVIGSIGVLAQLPNFHRMLQRHGVDFEQIKAGELKRTITMFGENSEEDRARARAQLEDTHALFKQFVSEYRPRVNLSEVATGEYWLGRRALERDLVDELSTSDDYLMKAREKGIDLYHLKYAIRQRFPERVMTAIRGALGPSTE